MLSGLEILYQFSRFGIIHKKVVVFECGMREWKNSVSPQARFAERFVPD
jgi:hypothetical protein